MYRKNRTGKKLRMLTAGLLILLLADVAAVPAFADQQPSPKDEVVYADLGGDGHMEQIYVVNIFEGQKSILDYGTYERVRNMTSTDKIREKGDQLLIDTDQEMLYYQGNLKKGSLPWNIALKYTLDGREISPKELAGKNGEMKLEIAISENPQAEKSFFNQYALQITAAFPTDKCENIRAQGATEANAGANKQLTWTLLPGTEKTLQVETEVKDFEMESISFNGIQLNMDVDVDSSEMTKKFGQLSAAVKAIDHGAKAMDKGAGELKSGAKKLKKGSDDLENNVKTISKQVKQAGKLGSASSEIKGAVSALDQGVEKIKSSVSYDAYKKVMAENGLNIDQLKQQNAQMLELLNQLKAQAGMLNEPQKSQYLAQISQGQKLIQGNIAAIQATETYLNSTAAGITEAQNGAAALAENYQTFDQQLQGAVNQLKELDLSQISKLTQGAEALSDGTGKLKSGSSALAQGTASLTSKTSGISGQVEEQINDMLEGIRGTDGEVTSFVSEKNTNVRSVQFVIKNGPIELPDKEPPAESPVQKQSWWQKLLSLFGID